MGRDADIVVIGAGITGVATARALAQAGRGVDPRRAVRPGSRARLESRGLADLPPLLPRPALRPAGPGCAAELAGARGGVRRAVDRADGGPRLRSGRGRERTCARLVRRPARAPHRHAGERPLADRRRADRAGALPARRRHDAGRQGVPGTAQCCRRRRSRCPRPSSRHRDRAGPRLRPGRHRRGRDHGKRLRRRRRGLGQRPPRRHRDRAPRRPHERDGRVLQASRSARPPARHRRCRSRSRGARPASARV